MASRRQAITSLLALAAWPAFAQQDRVWRMGFLAPNRRPKPFASHPYGAFVAGLADLGYVEGKNLSIEWRFADEGFDRLPGLVAELAKVKPDVLVTSGTAAARAAQKAAKGIPLVMLGLGDPVNSGLVDSLAHPGRNATGISITSSDVVPKQFELARTLVPGLERIGLVLNSANPAYAATLESAWRSAKPNKMLVYPVAMKGAAELEASFDLLKRAGVGAVLLQNDGVLVDNARRIAELAAKARLPSIAARREPTESGCLISYGTNVPRLYRTAARLIDKILKGANAGDLPVEQPNEYELVVNLRTAKAIGLTIPKEVLLRADKVIE